MIAHVLLPGIDLSTITIRPAYLDYLRDWRERAIVAADDGQVAASTCLQGTFIDLALDRKPMHDWIGVMDEFLMKDEAPLAYSDRFGQQLYRFDAQYVQSTVHSIHSRWWIEVVNGRSIDRVAYAQRIFAKKQTDALIYDRDVSETILRHRMKSELTLSAAMAADILSAAGWPAPDLRIELATAVTDPAKCPPLGYVTMESFRLRALTTLGHPELFPVGIDQHVSTWEEGLAVGWCDFANSAKVDAYMGTAKRTDRDKAVHSPLVACHVSALTAVMQRETRDRVAERMSEYAVHLREQPFDIRAFQMRDVPVPFGVDLTPIEAICASALTEP